MFNAKLRDEIMSLLTKNNIAFVNKAVYVQTHGPRFETPAEIAQLAAYADIVGMTCAHEADLFNEMEIPYAVICMTDNLGNGLASHQISLEEFHAAVHKNLATMESILKLVLAHFGPKAGIICCVVLLFIRL